MIKAGGQAATGEPLLLLGLSGENVSRLTAGEPIYIEPRQLEELDLPPMAVVLVYGRTEAELQAGLQANGIACRST